MKRLLRFRCLALAAVLVQAGCNSSEGPDEGAVAQQKTTGTKGLPSGKSGTANMAKPAVISVTLPEGTQLAVRTTTTLSTNSQTSGQAFTAHLEQPLLYDGREIAPKGAEVNGQIVDADKGGRVKGRASLAVELTGLNSNAGQIAISTNTITHEAKGTKKNDALKIGIGSGVGAAIGAVAGGGKGAAIGAAAGAGAGTGVVLATRGDPVVIPSETLLHFTLSAPITISGLK